VNCRHCSAPLEHLFLDLGFAPPSNAYLTAEDLAKPEKYYPLRVLVCDRCWLVQTEDYADAGELFDSNYAYFSSTSTSWLEHARSYAEMITARLALGSHSQVIEVASNDGYLLKNFLAAGIPCLGIEPTASTAAAAEALGIPVLREFFGERLGNELASAGRQADLIIGNNVFAHVPDINDFTRGLKAALKPGGTITLEFPHLLRQIAENQFDTIYHEHFSYLSLHAVTRIFDIAGLKIWDVEQLPTHGGSLRIYGCHSTEARQPEPAVERILTEEKSAGILTLETYRAFQARAEKVKDDFLTFLLEQKRAGKKVAAYGAAAKGNTLLNFAGIKPDLLPFVCDAAPAKQGKFLPGSHISICSPEILENASLNFLVILPWNIATEVRKQNDHLHSRGAKFVVAVPELKTL
jgi:SAM-dependent methyltransferase